MIMYWLDLFMKTIFKRFYENIMIKKILWKQYPLIHSVQFNSNLIFMKIFFIFHFYFSFSLLLYFFNRKNKLNNT